MPDWKNLIHNRIRRLGLTPAAEADLMEELAQHLEDRYRELLQGGAAEAEAYYEAAEELENEDAIGGLIRRRRDVSRAEIVQGSERSGHWFADLWKDLRFAARTIQKSPFFALFVVLTLGIGIGANTTVFTVINTLLLNPLPVPNSSQLSSVAASETENTARSGVPLPISYLNLRDYQTRNGVFDSLAGYTAPRPVTLEMDQRPERVFIEFVTGDYFSTLNLHAVSGRFFLPEEDSPNANAVAVLNYGVWQRRFGGAPDIIGRTLRINRVPVTVVGIAPPKFIGISAIFGPDLWIPASMAEKLLPTEMRAALMERSKAVFQTVGRLKPGVSYEQARANIQTIAAALARQYPESNEGYGAAVRPIRDAVFSSFGSGTSTIMFAGAVLLAVVGIVLLIACSNVANLLLARATARRHEIAVRLAMGASRGRLIRQLLTESISLGVLSGIAGLLIGIGGVHALWTALPPSANFIAPKLDGAVFAFTLIVSLATGFAFGIFPALRASRIGVADALKEDGRSVGKSRERLNLANALLAGQVAFSFLLLMTSALFLRSIGRAYQMDPGFQTEHLAVFMTSPGQAGYGKTQATSFYKQVRDRLSGMPGVASASWASNLPLWGNLVLGVEVEGREQRSKSDAISSILNTVDIGYFETAGVRLENGRDFTEMDREGSAPVAIVNEKMAHDYWPNRSALGQRIRLPGEAAMRQIVGVARTANYSTLAEPPQSCIYVPLAQKYFDSMTLYVRSKGDPEQIMASVQREVRDAGPGIMVNDTRTGRTLMDNGLFQARVAVMLLSIFGLLALGLASVGLYGIMAYSVHQRTREIGLRMALGAGQGRVLKLILKRGLTLVGIGMSVGVGAALLSGQLLSRMLYGISGNDPLSMGAAAVILLAVAFLACLAPAIAAGRVDPLTALRQE